MFEEIIFNMPFTPFRKETPRNIFSMLLPDPLQALLSSYFVERWDYVHSHTHSIMA